MTCQELANLLYFSTDDEAKTNFSLLNISLYVLNNRLMMIKLINTCQHLFLLFEASNKKRKAHLDLKMRPSCASYTRVLHLHLTIDSATCIAQIKISCF